MQLTHSAAHEWKGTSPVGVFPANGYVLFDMAGNVWELTESARLPALPRKRARPRVTWVSSASPETSDSELATKRSHLPDQSILTRHLQDVVACVRLQLSRIPDTRWNRWIPG